MAVAAVSVPSRDWSSLPPCLACLNSPRRASDNGQAREPAEPGARTARGLTGWSRSGSLETSRPRNSSAPAREVARWLHIEPRTRTKIAPSLGRLISFGFRKKRQQADSCDVSLTSTPTTTISATGGGALTCRPNRAPNVYSTLRYFPPPKPCISRQCACDSSTRRSLTDASVNDRRTAARPL
jgi:hypothetical protein